MQSGDKHLIIDKQGQETLVDIPGLKGVRDLSEGLAPYHTIDKAFGFINTEGKVVIPARYEGVGYFSTGLAWAKTSNGMVGYIDKGGSWVIEPHFIAGKDFEAMSGLARVKKGEQWCYVNKSGEIVYMNDTEIWSDFGEGFCKGKKNDMYGFFDAKGEWTIEPKFEGVRDFKNGYAAAKVNEKWGIIDKSGNWVIEATFDGIRDVENVKD